MPDEVVRLPKVSRAALWPGPIARSTVRARQDLQGIHAERHVTLKRDAFRVFYSTHRDDAGGGQMFNLGNDRSTNAFADLEAQLRALGASGDRLAEATTSLRVSARIFAAASARLRASAVRRGSTRPVLKLV